MKYGVEVWNWPLSALKAGDEGVVEGEEGSTAGDEDIIRIGQNILER